MLNPQQMAAVKYLDGPLLVLAGAGSGKTRVITQKIAYLIETCGYIPSTICAVTFTNKTAQEMRERVGHILPAAKRRGLKVSTFHTLGLNIIKQHLGLCSLKKGFSILDSEDSLQLIKNFVPPAKAQDKEYIYGIQQQISLWKNDLVYAENNTSDNLDAVAIYPQYQKALSAYNAVDFDDLIRLPAQLFMHHPEVLASWQNKIKYLLVDEYQDSNNSQYILVKLLTKMREQFTVVGDDDQSIYAWRGAKPENLGQLQHDYPRLKVIKLEQNYRSTGNILRAANELIANNPHIFDKKLWSALGPGDTLRILCCRDEQNEAEQVIADLISHKLRARTPFGDYAILYRGNHQSRVFEKILRLQSIPYRISGGESWFAKMEVKDIFAYLKLLCNEADNAAFLRVVNTPKRGIGDASLEALGQYAASRNNSLYACCDHLALSEWLADKPRQALTEFKQWMENIKKRLQTDPLTEILKQMIQESGYEAHIYANTDSPSQAQKRMENVFELIAWVGRLLEKKEGSTLSDVITTLILIDILEQSDQNTTETVQLMTLHASKGLEFPFVYLVGMEEELLPHRVSIENDQIEEERRLAYVGITRAQKALCLSLAKKRRKAGELYDCEPSRFLEELPQDNLEWFGKTGESNPEQSKVLAQSHLAGLRNLLQETSSS